MTPQRSGRSCTLISFGFSPPSLPWDCPLVYQGTFIFMLQFSITAIVEQKARAKWLLFSIYRRRRQDGRTRASLSVGKL